MKYDYDSYFFYETTPRTKLNIKLKVTLKEPVNENVLESSAVKAFHRFPYFRRTLRIDETGGHVLEPSEEEIVVMEEGREKIILGSKQTNHLFFCITWKDRSVYFQAAHSFCGGCGVMFWIKATLWQYLTDLHHTEISAEGFLTPLSPMLPGETALPDLAQEPEEEALPVTPFENTYGVFEDYRIAAANPSVKPVFIPIVIRQDELMRYARSNDGSPNSIISAIMFKTMARALKDREIPALSAKIAANYRADVGCPDTYRDMVRLLRVKYTIDMADWPIEKLSTVTRGKMFLQMQPELSWAEYKKVMAYRDGIDAIQDYEGKRKYADENSPIKRGFIDTYTISYAGNSEWGGLADYVDSVFSITDGNLMLELNALPGKICVSFQQILQDDRYLKHFIGVLDEEGIHYEIGAMEEKNLPGVQLGDMTI